MKTAERILITSLELFNQQGETNVSSVDIALELDISPGNLYYHYKGKEVIVAALFDLYRRQLAELLRAPTDKTLQVDEFFYFLYLLLEKAHLFRFLLHNPVDIAVKYPSVAKGYKALLREQEQGIEKLVKQMASAGLFAFEPTHFGQIRELIGLVFTQSQNYYWLKGDDINRDDYLYKSLSNILFCLLPYIKIEHRELQLLQQAIAEQQLGATSNSSAESGQAEISKEI